MQKKYVRKKPFYEKIADLCEVPADMILEVPVIVIRGKHEVEVNGCDGILKYDMGECVLSVGKDIESTTIDMLSQLIDDDSELISVYYGEDVTEEQVNSLTAKLEEAYPDLDLEVHSGGQPIYYYSVFFGFLYI